MNWTPQKHSIIVDEDLKDVLHETGFCIKGNIGLNNIKKLKEVYDKFHSVKTKEGGMFYSLYSLNLEYRKNIHKALGEIMSPLYNQEFQDYKSVINSFIVKFNGEESAFTLHQDSTSLDEFKHSPLSVWIPLQDTNINNGCLCVVPKSHHIFYPYRGISFPTPFEDIESTVRAYLEPIEMKAGDILLFDNRLVHFSPTNHSDSERVVVMSGLFPKEAVMENCFKDVLKENAPLEIYKQEEDFLLTNTTFFHDCTARPIVGEKIKELDVDLPKFSKEKFESEASKLLIPKTNIEALMDKKKGMYIVSEPNERKGTILSSIKDYFQ